VTNGHLGGTLDEVAEGAMIGMRGHRHSSCGWSL
jgi:hypothetical protein